MSRSRLATLAGVDAAGAGPADLISPSWCPRTDLELGRAAPGRGGGSRGQAAVTIPVPRPAHSPDHQL